MPRGCGFSAAVFEAALAAASRATVVCNTNARSSCDVICLPTVVINPR